MMNDEFDVESVSHFFFDRVNRKIPGLEGMGRGTRKKKQ